MSALALLLAVATNLNPAPVEEDSLASAAAPLRFRSQVLDGTDAAPAPVGQLPGSWTRRGDTNTRELSDWEFRFGVQYRLMYDTSNIPGPGGTGFSDAKSYDFLRQRLRLNLDLRPRGAPVGAFIQAEFRGGSGGTAPRSTDPRASEPSLNPFNFVDVRGLRYAWLYWEPEEDHRIQGGLLAVSDEFGDTLFSADWDFIVAGVEYLGADEDERWRLAALNLVEGVGSTVRSEIDQDGTLLIADYDIEGLEAGCGALNLGLHAYGLVVEENIPLGGTKELWLGPTLDWILDDASFELDAILSVGDLGTGQLAADGTVISGFDDRDAQYHEGYSVRLAGTTEQGGVDLAAMLLHSSGDRDGQIARRFVTPQSLFGTLGYWGYTHIFTANGPSDTNDLGLTTDNAGAGLWTMQLRAGLPVSDDSTLQFFGGSFRADNSRNGSRNMGHELGTMLTTELGQGLNVDVGLAWAKLGRFFGSDPDSLFEGFVRAQLQF